MTLHECMPLPMPKFDCAQQIPKNSKANTPNQTTFSCIVCIYNIHNNVLSSVELKRVSISGPHAIEITIPDEQ